MRVRAKEMVGKTLALLMILLHGLFPKRFLRIGHELVTNKTTSQLLLGLRKYDKVARARCALGWLTVKDQVTMHFADKNAQLKPEELQSMIETRRQLRSRDGSDTNKQKSAKDNPQPPPSSSRQHQRTSNSFLHRTTPVYFQAASPGYFGIHRRFSLIPASRATHMNHSGSYMTPSIYELIRLLQTKGGYANQEDEVWTNLFLGDEHAATDKANLRRLGITHILNAADGVYNVNTGAYFYRDMHISYYGIEGLDDTRFNMYAYFYPAARFIKHGLNTPGGKVLVHCAMGISRAATLVLAFLMIECGMNLVEAVETVIAKRPIYPNKGFLNQLRDLDIRLAKERDEESSPE